MDYDKTEIPTTYDKARALAPETRRLWRDLLSVHIDRARISLIIDLGCGPGRFSELLAAHFGVQVVGIDPSLKMLDQACRKPMVRNVVYCQGLAFAPRPASIGISISRRDAQSPYGLIRPHHICSEPGHLRRLIRVLHIAIPAFRSPELSGAPGVTARLKDILLLYRGVPRP